MAFREVPVLPVVVPLALLVLGIELWWLRRRALLLPFPLAVAVLGCLYVGGIVANTVFPIYLDKPAADPAWGAHLDVVPLTGYGLADALTNVAVLVPLGVLVPLVTTTSSWLRVGLLTAALSMSIETAQLVTARFLGGGHVADVNDVFFNVVGGVLGYAVLRLALRVPRVASAIARSQRPARRRTTVYR